MIEKISANFQPIKRQTALRLLIGKLMKLNDLKEQSGRAPLGLWLADDDDIVRDLIADVLTRDGTLRCSRQFSCAESLIKALDRETPPEIIVLDINMGAMSGIEAIPHIKSIALATRVFVMTTFYDSVKESSALEAGASGFFVKTECHERTIQRIRASAEPAMAAVAHARTECIPALRVSSPGRINSKLSESRSEPAGDSSPFIARTLGLLRNFVARNS